MTLFSVEAENGDPTEAPVPLDANEELVWRMFVRAMLVVPRLLDGELLAAQGLNLAEYTVLMHLSEAPGQAMRMGELANSVSITTGGLTRVVERLTAQLLVERVQAEGDKRGQVAKLTDVGMARLVRAWPTHLRGVRTHVMNHLVGLNQVELAGSLEKMAETDFGPPVRRRIPDR